MKKTIVEKKSIGLAENGVSLVFNFQNGTLKEVHASLEDGGYRLQMTRSEFYTMEKLFKEAGDLDI